MKADSQAPAAPAGRSIKTFAAEANVCVATIYNLEPEARPKSVRIGNRVVVIESPAEWLARVASMGGAQTKRWARKPAEAPQRRKLLRRDAKA